jgi:AraC-like DNA-binding protein
MSENKNITEETEKKINLIPEKSEQELLKKLEKFESSEGFLNNKTSLVNLSKTLKTNPKYLSEVVNRNKGKNFNSYINDLRINYILQKLKAETKYSNYKITSLAEECGYNSHSTFIAAFRSVTGISPSTFIKFLKEKEKNAS